MWNGFKVMSCLAAGLLLAACAAPTPEAPATTAVTPPSAGETPAPSVTLQPEVAPASLSLVEEFVDQFLAKDYAAAVSHFDDAVRAALPEEKLKEARESLDLQFGAFKEKGETRALGRMDKYDLVIAMLQFEKGGLGLRFSIDTNTKQIGGLFFVQSDQAADYEAPEYADVNTFTEQAVNLGQPDWLLPGTLTLPKGDGPFPAVVLVHGSGPNDRDETIGPNKPFKDLAWGLASQGIAVLRYDKRTKVHAQAMVAISQTITVKDETIDDALAAVDFLRQAANIDAQRIYVLGHSLGGYVAPRIGAADPELAGLIVMAGLTRPLEDAMLEQVQYIFSLSSGNPHETPLTDLQQQVAAVKALQPGDEAQPPILGMSVAYWLDLRNYRPTEVAQATAIPMLILQGERDYQVTMVDFKNWQAALSTRSDVTLKSYPDLNHLFMPGEGQATPQEYQTPSHVAENVISDIADWITH